MRVAMSVVVVVGAVVGIDVHALDIVSAYAHNDNSRDVVAVGSGPAPVGSVVAVVDPVSAGAGTVEAEDDTLVPALALEIEPEPAARYSSVLPGLEQTFEMEPVPV